MLSWNTRIESQKHTLVTWDETWLYPSMVKIALTVHLPEKNKIHVISMPHHTQKSIWGDIQTCKEEIKNHEYGDFSKQDQTLTNFDKLKSHTSVLQKAL